MLLSFYQRILGHPVVFNRIRPLFVGGVDWTVLYKELDAGTDAVVLDVGCGTGIAHQYLRGFREYHGFDTDPIAIDRARKNTAGPNIDYQCRLLEEDDLRRIQPTKILLSGLLHHLPNAEVLELLRMCGEAPTVERIATADTVYIPREHVSNLLAFFDRGRYVRNTEGFLALAEEANLKVVRHQIVRSHPEKGRALYLIMTLSPRCVGAL
ncbi:MAG TPA: class I SAM-dependent methyltransferase [Terriglobia bacterium]|nr:class I SAM-dependent methyltransferase [Terriglobia bacterium]